MEKTFWEEYGMKILWLIIIILVLVNVWKMWGKTWYNSLMGKDDPATGEAKKRLAMLRSRQPAQQLS